MQIRFLITNAYGGGGTIRTTLTMASALARRGHDVEVVSVFRRRVNPMFPVDDAVRLRPLLDQSRAKPPGRRRARLARRAGKALAGMPSRMIHHSDVRYSRFNLRSDLALLRYLRSLRGGVLVTTRAGLNLASARYVHRSVVRVGQEHVYLERHDDDLRAAFAKQYPRLDAVVTLTSNDARAYQDLLGDQVAVLTIPNAVPDTGHVHDPDSDAKVAIAAGRLTKPKGFDLLIDAWRDVAAAHPDWQLRIYGRGQAERRLQRQINRAGLGEQVHLMGFTKTLPERLAASSLFVMSSRFEGFSMVLLEAMACGLPVVSFDCPVGPAELVDHGVTGLLVDNGSVAALAREINRLIDDPGLRAKLGAAARQAAADYSSDNIAIRWEKLFEQHLTAHGTRRR